MEWIKCSERMPERCKNVLLAYMVDDVVSVTTGHYLGYENETWFKDFLDPESEDPFAWKEIGPYPEPPKEQP